MESLTARVVRHIARLPKAKGQQLLAHHLHLRNNNFTEDLKHGAFLDYYYDVLQFCTNRGMNWNDVANSLKFASEYFNPFLNSNMSNAVHILHHIGVNYVRNGSLKVENMKKLIRYFIENVLPHQKLFQYVFLEERDSAGANLELLVRIPPDVMDLNDAQTLEMWKYSNSYKEAQKQEERILHDLQMEKEVVDLNSQKIHEKMEKEILAKEEEKNMIDMKPAEDLISSLISNEVKVVEEDMRVAIRKMKDAARIAAIYKSIPNSPQQGNSPQNVKPLSKVQLKGGKTPPMSRKSSAISTPKSRRK